MLFGHTIDNSLTSNFNVELRNHQSLIIKLPVRRLTSLGFQGSFGFHMPEKAGSDWAELRSVHGKEQLTVNLRSPPTFMDASPSSQPATMMSIRVEQWNSSSHL